MKIRLAIAIFAVLFLVALGVFVQRWSAPYPGAAFLTKSENGDWVLQVLIERGSDGSVGEVGDFSLQTSTGNSSAIEWLPMHTGRIPQICGLGGCNGVINYRPSPTDATVNEVHKVVVLSGGTAFELPVKVWP